METRWTRRIVVGLAALLLAVSLPGATDGLHPDEAAAGFQAALSGGTDGADPTRMRGSR